MRVIFDLISDTLPCRCDYTLPLTKQKSQDMERYL